MSATLETTRYGRWSATRFSNEALSVVVVPELGGKIVSLRSRHTDREWLWHNPHIDSQAPPPDARDYRPFDSGGWDEIFPTVSPCRLPGSAWGDEAIADHGELWRRPWRSVTRLQEGEPPASLALVLDAPDLPFSFARTLTLADGDGPLSCDYRVTNRTPRPLPYLWAAHPLLAVRPGDSLRLPPGTRVEASLAIGAELSANEFPWPHARFASGEAINLSHVPGNDAGFALKLFATNVSPAVMEVEGPEGDRLRFSLQDGCAPHFGLWLNYGGWSGVDGPPYYNVSIEPTSSPDDDLAAACGRSSALTLAAGEERHWRFSVAVESLHT